MKVNNESKGSEEGKLIILCMCTVWEKVCIYLLVKKRSNKSDPTEGVSMKLLNGRSQVFIRFQNLLCSAFLNILIFGISE